MKWARDWGFQPRRISSFHQVRILLMNIPGRLPFSKFPSTFRMIAQLGAQPVSVQLSHDREGDGRFRDGADALGAWGPVVGAGPAAAADKLGTRT